MLESLPSAAFDDSPAPDAGGVALAIPPTDGERLMRFQRYRDESAFAQVVESHAKMVWGVCSQILRHQQDVEDAFQATFLILARKAGSIRASDSAAGWIYRVAYRTALLAHSRRCRRSESQLIVDLPSLDDQLSEIERNEVALRLLEELNALPLRYRQPLVLCYMEGHSRSEAATQMGVSTQTVKGLLARGTRLLRSRLIRRGIALSASMAVVNSAMSSAQAAAAPSLVSSTASLGMSFALKLKVTASGIKGASLKSVAACALAEKGIIAMTIAAASKPAVGILGVCLAVGMLAVADAEPAKRLAITGGEGSVMLISTDAGDEAAAAEGDQAVSISSDVQTTVDIAVEEEEEVDVKQELAEVEEEEEVDVESGDIDVPLDGVAPDTLEFKNVSVPAPVPPVPPVDVVVAAPAPVPGLPATGATAFSLAGTPPVQVVEDVLVPSDVPLPAPAVQPLPPNFELARKFEFQYQNTPIASSFLTLSDRPASAGGSSEAALKIEGEYWALKAAGLQKKSEAIQLKVERAKAQIEAGQSELNEGDILDLAAEKDLTLAEVKLCEMNAQRVRDALEERAKAKDGEEGAQAVIKKAMGAAAEAQRDAAEAQRNAAIHAKQAAQKAVEAAKGEAAKAAAKAWTIRAEAPAIKIERRLAPAKAPAAPKAPAEVREIRIDGAPYHVESDMATLPKEELKKLLSLVESTKKLEERLQELEAESKQFKEGKKDSDKDGKESEEEGERREY